MLEHISEFDSLIDDISEVMSSPDIKNFRYH